VYASVGGKLLAFHYPFVEVREPERTPSSDDDKTEQLWSWTDIRRLPFTPAQVSSYAVHPDGRKVFVSVHRLRYRPYGDLAAKIRDGTFTFDMHRGVGPPVRRPSVLRPRAGRLGRALPQGRGRARVRLRRATAGRRVRDRARWNLSRDVFFDAKESGSEPEVYMGATLVYKGDSRFCLLATRMATDEDPSKRVRMVKMTSFAVKYDKEGDLRATYFG
jgi:hypothetical protein